MIGDYHRLGTAGLAILIMRPTNPDQDPTICLDFFLDLPKAHMNSSSTSMNNSYIRLVPSNVKNI